ncbi:thiol peroxidase [Klebsiella aerogenes]|nr:thiol peroxidase [Klebsiella aerogenes]
MSQTVHFQGNPVSVQGTIPQAGAKAQRLRWSPKISLTSR